MLATGCLMASCFAGRADTTVATPLGEVSFEVWEMSAPPPGEKSLARLDWGEAGRFLGGVGKYGLPYGVKTPNPVAVSPRKRCQIAFEGRVDAVTDTFIVYAEVFDKSGRKVCAKRAAPAGWNYSSCSDTYVALGIPLSATGRWERVERPFTVPDGVATLRLAVCPWRGNGVWCRSLAVTERNGLTRRRVVLDGAAEGLALDVRAEPDAFGGRAITATLRDVAQPPRPRALQLKLALRRPLAGWTYHRDWLTDEPIAGDDAMTDAEPVGGLAVSRYPFTAVSKDGAGFMLATPIDAAAYESRAVTTNGIVSTVAVGLKKRAAGGTSATFRWQATPFRGDWGFRSAARAYYALQGDALPRPQPGAREGTWLWPIWPSRAPDRTDDFGLAFWEAPSTILNRPEEVEAAHRKGLGVFPYTEAWGMRQTLRPGADGALPPVAARMAELRGWAENDAPGKTWFDVPRRIAAQAALNSLPVKPDGEHPFVVDKYDSWSHWWRTNADPRLARPNRASICWDATFAGDRLDRADGVYLDSVSYGFAVDFRNVRPDHLAVMDEPLVYDVETAVPCADGLQHQVAFVKWLSGVMHARGKRVFGNVFGIAHRFHATTIDIFGSEVGGWGAPGGETRFRDVASDREAGEKRFYAYHRPITDLLQEGRYSAPVKEFSARAMTNYVERQIFYGFYPGVSTIGGEEKAGYANWKRYFGPTRQCERDRALFKAAVPLIRRLNRAGWQPEPLVRSSEACVRVERYGEAGRGEWFVTVRNASDKAVRTILRPEPRIPNPEPRIPNLEPRTPNPEPRPEPVWQGSPTPEPVPDGFALALAPWKTAVYRMGD